MNFREEIQNILRLKGIATAIESNKIVFAIATIGLLIGKDEFREIVFQTTVDDRRRIWNRTISALSMETEREIAKTAFNLIPISIDRKTLIDIIEIVLKFDLRHIVLDLGIFDYVNTSLKEHQNFGQISNVEWINKLVIEILKMHRGKTLYNNDCATGDLIMDMFNKGIIERAIGNTSNNSDYEIVRIRQYFAGKDFKVTNESFFSPDILNAEKVDMVYCSYPLMMKYEKEEVLPMIDSWDFHFLLNKKYSANLLWMINALQSIKPDGIVVAFVANGILFNGIDEEIRKYLVINNYIDTIISLPNGILPYTGVASSLVILRKNKGEKYTIRMIDASDVYSMQRRHKFFSQEDIEYIINLYTSDNHTEKSRDVTLDEIMINDAYLGMNRYYTYTIENAVSLGSVTDKIFRGYQLTAKELDNLIPDEDEETEYRIINISDIQAEGFVNRDLSPIKSSDKKNYDKFVVEDGDIIITAKNTTIKSAIYRSNGNYKDVLSGNLIAIRVDSEKINPYYLKAFFDSEKGDMAIKSIQTGTSITTINANGLKDMKISLLSMAEQEAIGNEYKNNLDLIVDLLEKYKIAANYSNQIFDKLRKTNIQKDLINNN